MTKKRFHQELVAAASEAEKHLSVADICRALFIGRSVYYRWIKGKNAPIVLARHAVIQILHGLVP